MFLFVGMSLIGTYLIQCYFLYPLINSETQRFSDDFWGYRKGALAFNGLMLVAK